MYPEAIIVEFKLIGFPIPTIAIVVLSIKSSTSLIFSSLQSFSFVDKSDITAGACNNLKSPPKALAKLTAI